MKRELEEGVERVDELNKNVIEDFDFSKKDPFEEGATELDV
jgi:hypothetical protein